MLSSIGIMCAVFLFVAPASTLLGCIRKGTTGDFTPLPYIFAAAQCWCWSLYCLPMSAYYGGKGVDEGVAAVA